MKILRNDPPRIFNVGKSRQIELRDCGKILLSDNEMVTFITEDDKEYDFTAKSWGFYSTPSINSRLKNQGFKTALTRKRDDGKFFVMSVDVSKMDLFKEYTDSEDIEILEWLDERQKK